MSYTHAVATLSKALLSAFPKNEMLRSGLAFLGAGAMAADYVFAKRAERLRQMQYDQNIYMRQAELYRKEADRLKTESRYLREEGASPDTDCFSCATAHLAGMEGALRRAAKEAEKEGGCGPGCQRWVHIAAQEPAALFARDWTKEKYAKLPPEQKALIDRYAPRVEESMKKIAPTPEGEGVLRAAALLKESVRFAEAGDDIRHPEVEWRRLQAEAELSAAERLRPGILPPEVSQELRRLRQQVGSGITDTQSLVEAARKADKLSLKINAHSWQQTNPADLARLADEVHAIRAGFAAERAKLGGLGFISPTPVDPERHHTIPREVIETYTTPGTGPIAGLNRQQIQQAFDNVLARLEERGVRVRFRDLPVTMEYAIEGAYTPGYNAIVLNASKMSKDSYALQTLLHEGTHSLLHNKECHPVVSKKPYSQMPEEIEAHTASMAAMLELGVPIEDRFGQEIKPGEVKIDWEKVKEKAGPQAEENIRWAVSWLVRAARGEDTELVREKCPALRRAG